MSHVWILQHAECESLGLIASALKAANILPKYIRTFEGQSIPQALDGAAGLVVMGGPMGVYEHDRYSFLREEMCLIEDALGNEKPILGVCLGSQLLAAALGATVKPGKQKEIGWFPITLTESAQRDPLWHGIASPFVAYHWHGDIFDLPYGATALASSALTECQAFHYGANAYGFLFHLEVAETIIQEMVATFADELAGVRKSGREIIENSKAYLPHLHQVGNRVFRRWTSLINKE